MSIINDTFGLFTGIFENRLSLNFQYIMYTICGSDVTVFIQGAGNHKFNPLCQVMSKLLYHSSSCHSAWENICKIEIFWMRYLADVHDIHVLGLIQLTKCISLPETSDYILLQQLYQVSQIQCF